MNFRQLFGKSLKLRAEKSVKIWKWNCENAKKFDELWLKFWMLSGAKACLVDLVKSFQTSIYLQNSASMQPRTSPVYRRRRRRERASQNSPKVRIKVRKKHRKPDTVLKEDHKEKLISVYQKVFHPLMDLFNLVSGAKIADERERRLISIYQGIYSPIVDLYNFISNQSDLVTIRWGTLLEEPV